jgi:hypothetical protein
LSSRFLETGYLMNPLDNHLLRNKLNMETARVPWSELQRHFAAGSVVCIADSLDLVEVAFQMSQDNKAMLQPWIEQQRVARATDAQAAQWLAQNAELWAVVCSPWVLVQQNKPGVSG